MKYIKALLMMVLNVSLSISLTGIGVIYAQDAGTGDNKEGDMPCTIEDAEGKKSSCSTAAISGIHSCLGKELESISPVQYYSKTYQVGKNGKKVCMWNEASKEGCDYIGKDRLDASGKKKNGDFTAGDFCCGIKLNTEVPFVGKCITNDKTAEAAKDAVTSATAFPSLMKAMIKVVMVLIMVGSMIMLVASGLMRTSGSASEGKSILNRVILSLVLLGASGIILRLINPVFFT